MTSVRERRPNNPYVILQTGHTHVLKSEDEIVVVHATEDVREIQGVLCRVVVDIVVEAEEEEGEEVGYTAVEVRMTGSHRIMRPMSTIAVKCREITKMVYFGTSTDPLSPASILPKVDI